MQKILVTGATGFIGKALVQAMTKQNFNVIAGIRKQSSSEASILDGSIDNGNYYFKPGAYKIPYASSQNKCCTSLQAIKQVELGDLSSVTDHTVALQGVDVVIHLAARAHIMHDTASDPLAEFRKINTTGTLNFAIQAANAGVKRFIFISSIKVNGEMTTNGIPFQVEFPTPPTDPYALSKYEAEHGLLSLAKNTGMEVVIIRPTLVYGPGVKGNFAVMIKWLLTGIPLPLGMINNQRSFVALDNLVSFIMLCITHPRAANEVFLISDGEDVSTTQLLQKIARAFNKRALLLPIPVICLQLTARLIGQSDKAGRLFNCLQVDSSKASDLLGWHPVISMDQQLKKIAESYQA